MVIEEIDKYYLYPSTVFAHGKGHIVDTVLGSCVSVCLFDTRLKIGGINHYMLPYWNGEGLASPKYGNIANEKLLEKLLRLGCTKTYIVAKVFGGANQINSSINVGDRNVMVAREQLETMGIRVISESVGGAVGRKIRYNTFTNEVLMKFLAKKEI
jgi:chemotaxis protein CheD